MYKKILVPVDGSGPLDARAERGDQARQESRLATAVGTRGQRAGADRRETPPVYVDKVADFLRAEGQAILDKAERVVREHALAPQTVLLESIGGRAADLIVEQAKNWGAELIVMGTHGRRGIHRLALGSDAELVVRSSSVPVLLLRAETA